MSNFYHSGHEGVISSTVACKYNGGEAMTKVGGATKEVASQGQKVGEAMTKVGEATKEVASQRQKVGKAMTKVGKATSYLKLFSLLPRQLLPLPLLHCTYKPQ